MKLTKFLLFLKQVFWDFSASNFEYSIILVSNLLYFERGGGSSASAGYLRTFGCLAGFKKPRLRMMKKKGSNLAQTETAGQKRMTELGTYVEQQVLLTTRNLFFLRKSSNHNSNVLWPNFCTNFHRPNQKWEKSTNKTNHWKAKNWSVRVSLGHCAHLLWSFAKTDDQCKVLNSGVMKYHSDISAFPSLFVISL